MERFIRLLFLLIWTLFITSALGQTTQSSTGDGAVNTSQSNLLGSNIGTQQNSTNVTGGYGNVNSNNPGTTTAKVYSVPTMYAPGLTAAGSDVCLGSVSASGSILGLGLAGGGTYVDDNCVLLKNSQRMAVLGFGNAAVVMMLQNKDIEKAIRTSSPSVFLQVSKDRLANLQAEFDDVIMRLAVMEKMLMKIHDEEKLDTIIKNYYYENMDEIDVLKKSMYMELAGKLIYRLAD